MLLLRLILISCVISRLVLVCIGPCYLYTGLFCRCIWWAFRTARSCDTTRTHASTRIPHPLPPCLSPPSSPWLYTALARALPILGTRCLLALFFLPLLRSECLIKTDSGYPKDKGDTRTVQTLGISSDTTPLGHLHQSPPSPIPEDLGRGPSHQSTCSNIETRMDRPKSVVRVIRGVA